MLAILAILRKLSVAKGTGRPHNGNRVGHTLLESELAKFCSTRRRTDLKLQSNSLRGNGDMGFGYDAIVLCSGCQHLYELSPEPRWPTSGAKGSPSSDWFVWIGDSILRELFLKFIDNLTSHGADLTFCTVIKGSKPLVKVSTTAVPVDIEGSLHAVLNIGMLSPELRKAILTTESWSANKSHLLLSFHFLPGLSARRWLAILAHPAGIHNRKRGSGQGVWEVLDGTINMQRFNRAGELHAWTQLCKGSLKGRCGHGAVMPSRPAMIILSSMTWDLPKVLNFDYRYEKMICKMQFSSNVALLLYRRRLAGLVRAAISLIRSHADRVSPAFPSSSSSPTGMRLMYVHSPHSDTRHPENSEDYTKYAAIAREVLPKEHVSD